MFQSPAVSAQLLQLLLCTFCYLYCCQLHIGSNWLKAVAMIAHRHWLWMSGIAEWFWLMKRVSIFWNYQFAELSIFTPLRVGWPPTPQVYFGPWEGLRVVSPVGAPQAKNFHFPPVGAPKLGNFHFSPPWGLPKLGNFHFSPRGGSPS